MRHIRRARHVLAVLVFAVVGLLFGSLHLYATLGIATLRKETGQQRRFRVDAWQSFWGLVWYRCCCWIGGVSVEYVYDKSFVDYLERGGGPTIIVGNHYGAFDVIMKSYVLRKYGLGNYRPIAKAGIGKIPIIGRAWKESAGFMLRNGAKDDLDTVSRTASTILEDGTHALIYPEGTVLTEATATEGNRTVLPKLKHRGFRLLVRGLPGYERLVYVMLWHDFEPWRGSDEGIVPPGTKLTVLVKVLPPLPAEATNEEISIALESKFSDIREFLRTA